MSQHPVTPMHEADLRAHLASQTKASIALMSIVDLETGDRASARHAELMGSRPGMLLYDVLDDPRLRTAGRLIWEDAQREPHFAVGSSGVEYALAAHWRAIGLIPALRATLPPVAPVKQLLVMSGSASPMTAQQIAWAAAHGFDAIRAPAEDMVQSSRASAAYERLLGQALAGLAAGKSIVVYSAAGPDDPSIGATRAHLDGGSNAAKLLGAQMGRMARELLERTGLRRLVIAGGDTSSYATRELGLYALEMAAELTPGAPLCRGHSSEARFDGLEIALKGGQMGKSDYFGMARGDRT
jgi:uncharacterized protein YgbK (DUF1537 family)